MRAIDIHVHVPREPGVPPTAIEEQMSRYFRTERWLREFEDLSLKAEVRPKILLENAKKVLKLK